MVRNEDILDLIAWLFGSRWTAFLAGREDQENATECQSSQAGGDDPHGQGARLHGW